jgi:hypothetical protein
MVLGLHSPLLHHRADDYDHGIGFTQALEYLIHLSAPVVTMLLGCISGKPLSILPLKDVPADDAPTRHDLRSHSLGLPDTPLKPTTNNMKKTSARMVNGIRRRRSSHLRVEKLETAAKSEEEADQLFIAHTLLQAQLEALQKENEAIKASNAANAERAIGHDKKAKVKSESSAKVEAEKSKVLKQEEDALKQQLEAITYECEEIKEKLEVAQRKILATEEERKELHEVDIYP